MSHRAFCIAVCLLGACAQIQIPGHHPDIPEDPTLQYPVAPEPKPYTAAEGSLWQGEASRRFLAFENRAKRPGDLITVQINEKAEAASAATTDLERKSSFDSDLKSDVALQTLITRPIRRVLSLLGFDTQRGINPVADLQVVDAQTNTKFEGDGSVERESKLKTTIACMVVDVTTAGLMRIEGQREITINHETQIMRISGYVRPEDVLIDNTVSSALIAQANIEFSGRGVVSDKQRVPWLTRFLELVLPF